LVVWFILTPHLFHLNLFPNSYIFDNTLSKSYVYYVFILSTFSDSNPSFIFPFFSSYFFLNSLNFFKGIDFTSREPKTLLCLLFSSLILFSKVSPNYNSAFVVSYSLSIHFLCPGDRTWGLVARSDCFYKGEVGYLDYPE